MDCKGRGDVRIAIMALPSGAATVPAWCIADEHVDFAIATDDCARWVQRFALWGPPDVRVARGDWEVRLNRIERWMRRVGENGIAEVVLVACN
jgi:hypothetical protein